MYKTVCSISGLNGLAANPRSEFSPPPLLIVRVASGITEWRRSMRGLGSVAFLRNQGIVSLKDRSKLVYLEEETGQTQTIITIADKEKGHQLTRFVVGKNRGLLVLAGNESAEKGKIDVWDFDSK